jgi:hypothetical protein
LQNHKQEKNVNPHKNTNKKRATDLEKAANSKTKAQDSFREGALEQIKTEGYQLVISTTTKKSIILQKDKGLK